MDNETVEALYGIFYMPFVGKMRRYYGGRNRNFRLINKEVRAVRSIGLITYHHTTNFGSLLQTYALYKTVTQMGYNCRLLIIEMTQ